MLYQPIILIGRILTRVYSSERTILREMHILLPVLVETADSLQTLMWSEAGKFSTSVRVKYVTNLCFIFLPEAVILSLWFSRQFKNAYFVA